MQQEHWKIVLPESVGKLSPTYESCFSFGSFVFIWWCTDVALLFLLILIWTDTHAVFVYGEH